MESDRKEDMDLSVHHSVKSKESRRSKKHRKSANDEVEDQFNFYNK